LGKSKPPVTTGGRETRRGRPRIDEITDAQRRTLAAIRSFLSRRGFPPSIHELGELLGVAPASAHEQVSQLVRKGYLRRDARKARSIEVLKEPEAAVAELLPVPIVGTVAAGRPILAVENIVGELLVEQHIVGRGPCFALKVEGDSMIGAGIHDGDHVVVRQQPIAEHGDIVVALLGDEATVKRLHIAGERIELRPENSRLRPITIGPEDDLRIAGKVMAVRCAAGPRTRRRPDG
jgi:repressor LexA